MDDRIRQHAEVIIDHCIGVQADDNVVIAAPADAEDLVVALQELLGQRGANPMTMSRNARFSRAYLRNADEGQFTEPEHELALFKETDALIAVRGGRNATETSDVPPETRAKYQQTRDEIREARLDTQWCLTQYPTHSHAQLAEMSTEAYEDFVWEAVNKDWEAQRELQSNLVDILDEGSEVRIVSGDETDIRASIDGMIAVNDDAEHNLPGGEVFTAPVVGSVEGEVLFDKPLYHQGREVENVRLEFEDGEVVAHSATKNEELLSEVLNTDDGARRLGELGFGMNRDIDRFTYNMLFDEKMGDTVHMAVGRAYDDTVGEERTQNESAVHVDMIVDMSEDSRIEVDGDVIQRNGSYVFEDDFED